MGMFDTIIFPESIPCSFCGKLHNDTQTKQFENILIKYFIGDILPSKTITGIIKETFICIHESMEKRVYEQDIYLVLWNHILINIVNNLEQANRFLANFGLNELCYLYVKIYHQKIDYETKYKKLKTYIRIYEEYLEMSIEEQEKFREKSNKTFISFPEMEVIKHLGEKKTLEKLIQELDNMNYDEKSLF